MGAPKNPPRGLASARRGCGAGVCCSCWRRGASTARGIELSRARRQPLRRQGLAGCRDADTDLGVNYALTMLRNSVILSRRAAARGRQRRVWLENLLRIAACAICRSDFGFCECGCSCSSAGHMPRTRNVCRDLVRYGRTSISAPSRSSCSSATKINVKMEFARRARSLRQAAVGYAPWWFWNMFARQVRVLLSPGRKTL